MNHASTPSIRVAITLAGLSLAFLLVQSVTAQNDQATEEIVITGSRIGGVEPVGTAVISLDRGKIESAGQVTLDRMIKEVPQNFDLGVSENSRGQAGGNGNIVWGNSVNLRGIGPYATLILIDGHRVINNSRSIDPSILPALGVERVEILVDGASAVYGSDAIAGVVNIIPRRTLDGVEAFARTGFADHGDFNEYVLGLAAGKTWDNAQLMVAYEHSFRDNLPGAERDYFTSDQTAFGGNDYRVTRCAPGTLRNGAVSYAMPDQLTAANAAGLVAGTVNRCDDLVGQDLFPQHRYDTVNATGSIDVNDWMTLFVDGFYSKREFVRQTAYPTATLTVPNTNAFFVAPAGFAGANYRIDYSFIDDLPRDTQTGFARNWEVTPGVRVALPRDWQIEALVTYGRNRDEANSYAGVNNTALAAALASNNPQAALDPYGLGRTAQSVLDGIANQIFLAPTLNEFTGYEARVNGTLFDLPGGGFALAAGYEHQDQDVDLGQARGNPGTPIAYRSFSRDVDSVYAELFIPVFGAGNARSGFERLDLTAAIRYDDYSDVGDTTNAKFGASWSPLEPLTIRGSYSESFRAPLISQIYGNSNALFGQSYQNPAGGAALSGFAYSGPNLNLGPEEAKSWSIGADFDPIPDLRLRLTYFGITYENQIETYLGNLSILSQEAEFAGTGIILRGAAAAARVVELLGQGITLARGSFPGGDPNNVTLYVDGRNNNLGRARMRGLDFQAQYLHDAGAIGTFGFDLGGTLITSYKVAITPTAALIARDDTIYNPLKFKARGALSWAREPFTTQLVVNHVGGYTNTAVTPNQKVASYSPVDLTFAWAIGDTLAWDLFNGLTLGFEVRNLFDEEPPYVNIAQGVNGSGGYDPTVTNPVGRLFGVSLRKHF